MSEEKRNRNRVPSSGRIRIPFDDDVQELDPCDASLLEPPPAPACPPPPPEWI